MAAIFVLTFAPPTMAAKGRGRVGNERAEVAHLLLQEQAGDAGEKVRDADSGGVSAVGGAEGVVHVERREGAEDSSEDAVVRLLLGVEAQVFEQGHVTGTEGLGDLHGGHADAVFGEGDGLAEQLGETLADGREAELGVALALRAAEVGADEDGGAARDEVLDRRQGLANAGVVGNGAILEGHVEVGAQEDALSADIDVTHGLLADAVRAHPFTPRAPQDLNLVEAEMPGDHRCGERALAKDTGRGDAAVDDGGVEAVGGGGPSSMATAQWSPREASACVQVVGLGSPWRLALEAARGGAQFGEDGLEGSDGGHANANGLAAGEGGARPAIGSGSDDGPGAGGRRRRRGRRRRG